MRNTLLKLSISAFLITVIFSCTKDPANSTTNISGKIKSVTDTMHSSGGISSGQYNYYYNSDGSINYYTLQEGNITPYFAKSVFSYSPNIITITSYNSANIELSEGRTYLRSNGLVDSSVVTPFPTDSITVTHILYDVNNYPNQILSYSYAPGSSIIDQYGSSTFSFSNGDLVTENNGSDSQTWDYYNTISNLTPHAYGLTYSLLQSTHLMKTSYSNNVISSTFTYTFDSNNRVTTATEHIYESGIDDGDYDTVTYTYY